MFDIVMPLFNKRNYVERAVESVLGQSFADWTLFIVDDGSTDDSVAVVERIADPRITAIRQENAGPGAARNRGILAGCAEWIAFLDADDLWLPDHLQTLDEIRRQFPSASLIGAAYRQWYGGDTLADTVGRGSSNTIRYFREASSGRAPFFTSSAAFSREAIGEVGLLKPVTVGDEMDLWARLALHGPVAASTQETALYRVGTGGITDTSPMTEVTSLAQLSPQVATLLERLNAIRDAELRKDVEEYVDYEIGLTLIRAVRTGQIAYARRVLKMFLGRPRGKARVAAWLARLPAPMGQRLMHLIFAAKRLGRIAS